VSMNATGRKARRVMVMSQWHDPGRVGDG
jgi:hypothetical protein